MIPSLLTLSFLRCCRILVKGEILWERRLGWAFNSAVKCLHSWDPAVSMPVKHTLFYNNPHIGSLHKNRNPINFFLYLFNIL